MPGETEKKQRRNSGAPRDGDDHLPVCILKVMKITPRPNITGIIMRLGFVKKFVAEEICTHLSYAGPRSDFCFCFHHALCCVSAVTSYICTFNDASYNVVFITVASMYCIILFFNFLCGMYGISLTLTRDVTCNHQIRVYARARRLIPDATVISSTLTIGWPCRRSAGRHTVKFKSTWGLNTPTGLACKEVQSYIVQLLPDHSRRKHRYDRPPTEDITLEEFETCAIDRLYVLTEIESCHARNRPFEELKKITKLQCDKHVPLDHNSAITKDRDSQRKKDITGHFVLRLAFCRSYVCLSKS